ncbi:hypothetical protein D3C72_1656770 [compost metagenome]
MTVVWSRPPNLPPMMLRESPVSSRDRYMATWRAWAMSFVRRLPTRSAVSSRKCSATISMISAHVTCLAGAISPRTCWARPTVTGTLVMPA